MMRTTTTLLLAIVSLASCSQYQKAPSGMKYKITKGGSKETLKQGQFVKFHIEYKLSPKDTVLNVSFGHVPAYFVIDTTRLGKYNFTEFITKMAPGDKAEFALSIDTLKKMQMIDPNSPDFHSGDMINGRIEIIKTFPNQEAMIADHKKEVEAEKEREVKELADYTTKQGIKTQKTVSGVLVEIQRAGEGQKADSGFQASVMYKGYFTDAKRKSFDSNNETASLHKDPLQVIIGSPGMIPGMDEGLRLFAKGGKGRLFIPCMLAYGERGMPPAIRPWDNLVFDVEVTDVAKPAPAPAAVAPAPAPNAAAAAQPKK